MEAVLGRSSCHGGTLVVKEEIKRVESNGDDIDQACKQEDFPLKNGKERPYDENDINIKRSSSSPKQKDVLSSSKQVPLTTDHTERSSIEPDSMASSSRRKGQQDNNDKLESTKAEMGEVREENQRLKMFLGRIMKDYETLQMQFNNIVQQDQSKINHNKSPDSSTINTNHHQEIYQEETELVSLSLGSFSANNNNPKINKDEIIKSKLINHQEGLSLGLMDYKHDNQAPAAASKSGATDHGGPAVSNPSAASSFEEPNKEEEAGQTWPPSKVLKTSTTTTTTNTAINKRSSSSVEDEVSQQNPIKKARVCVRARCDTPTMIDGCQWRKYGQKIAKGNPCPRAYYRCTVAPSCPVRKQVQRCAEDMSILITTYEGTHNHPLPISATAMASTTSAAASMLLSGSSSSSAARPGGGGPNNLSSTATAAADLHGFNTFDSSKMWNKQLYLTNSSSLSSPYSSFSSSSHPTITLDLTTSTNKFSSSSSILPNYPHPTTHTFYPSTSLSFGNSNNSDSWTNINGGVLSYGTSAQLYNNTRNQTGSISTLGGLGRSQNLTAGQTNNVNVYQNYMQKNIGNNPSSTLPDNSTIAAATKAITADPAFQSALAAALTSIIGGGGAQGSGDQHGNINSSNNNMVQKLRWGSSSGGDHQQFPASLQTPKGNIGCAPAAFSANSQAAAGANGLLFLSPAASKSASASPADTREQAS